MHRALFVSKDRHLFQTRITAPAWSSTLGVLENNLTEMKQRTFNYSLKNIPIPPEKLYKKRLLEKIDDVTKRMRWKAYFLERNDTREEKDNYGFKTRTCPPPTKEMENFENDLIEMAQNVDFR